MSRILWMLVVKKAWTSYVKRMNQSMKPHKIETYLSQEIDLGMKLEEFAEIIFIEGFVAGEKYAKSFVKGPKMCEPELN
ncbi:MAG: hypothetical protein WCK32_00685 [Chlorobiaceae bacterium]